MAKVNSTVAHSNTYDDRRAFRRFIVNLKGQCCQGEGVCHPIEIHDFCLGGMYAVYSTEPTNDQLPLLPGQDEIVSIKFSLPSVPEETLQFQGRVVRSDITNLGIAFVRPDSLILNKVMDYARHYEEQKALSRLQNTSGNESVRSGSAYDVLLKNVRAMTSKPVHTLIDAYVKKQLDTLMDMADKSVDINEQNSYFSAIELLNSQGRKFKADFINAMQKIINSAPESIEVGEQAERQALSSSSLSLVDDDAIDDWIARSDISGKAESVYFEALAGIEQRLSELLGMKIWKQNNPLGPEAFSRAFQEALKELGLARVAYLFCCKTFRNVLSDGLGELYKSINNYLIDNKILPELHYEIKVQAGAEKSAKRSKPKADIVDTEASLTTLDDHDDSNLYELISSLQSIRAKREDHVPGRPRMSAQELLGKLSELSGSGIISHRTDSDSAKLRSQSLQILNQFEQSPGEFSLDTREAAIMEATGSIYDALYEDEAITSGVKQWLSKVELPLLHEAIKDESVLADKGHVARTFINQLAKLELYNDDGRDHISNSVKNAIEGLLKEVSEQPGMNEQLMSSLLAKVNALVNVQSRAYNDNFNESLEQCGTETPLPVLKLKQSVNDLPVPDEAQMNEWRKRIRRIRVGDWILFDAGLHESIRLKLAWIADNYDQYAFVNMLGLMEGAISVDDLACLLSTGSALFLEDMDEPAVDRAQYKMLHKLHSQLMHETTHDQLTTLMNRREFEKQIKIKLDAQGNVSKSNVVCIFDVDYFEVVNTTFGYDAGDRLLLEISEFFKDFFSHFGMLARVGGNEFAVLLTDCTLQKAIDIVEKQKNQFSNYRFQYEGSSTVVTLSTGIVSINLQQQEIPRLLQTAEAACRLAKSKGVNCLHVVDVDDNQILETQKVMEWASKIDDSLVNDSLVLRYQAITPISEGTTEHHAEILLGVTDKEGSLVSPEPFILAAEKFRRMPEIDRWVVKNVFAHLNANPDTIDIIGGVAVNLSGLSISDESFIPFIREQIETLKVPAECITFEITETAGIESLSSAAEFINEIKKMGCSFSLDDFGTGMSTYTYLKKLPVDFIKIDGSFVCDIEDNENDKAVVKSITEIGHFMGKKIIAECVENDSTIEILKSLNVDYVQGYAIARPKPLTSLLT